MGTICTFQYPSVEKGSRLGGARESELLDVLNSDRWYVHTHIYAKGFPIRVTVHIPDDLGPRLKQAAHNEGLSVSALTAKAVKEYLKRRRKKAAGNHLLDLIRPDSVAPDAWEEIEIGRADDRA